MESVEEIRPISCRFCRSALFSKCLVVDSHGANILNLTDMQNIASKACTEYGPAVWYIPEDRMPEWMKNNLEKGNWTKGKLHCPSCEARLGSYNFVSGLKCTCKAHVLPPIHIVKSKVDVIIPINITTINR